MPRLAIWNPEISENEHRDFCQHHYKRGLFNAKDDHGDRVDDDCEHPPYEEQYPAYKCRDCGAQLGEDDN